MDGDSDEEVHSDQHELASNVSGDGEGPASPDNSGPASPIGPGSPIDDNGPQSPDVEPASPDNYDPASPIEEDEGPESPDQEPLSPSSPGPVSPDNNPASPIGSENGSHQSDAGEKMEDEDAEKNNQSDDEEEVVREDVDSADEDARCSDNDGKDAVDEDEDDDVVERASVVSEGGESHQGDGENDDANSVHSEIEERASIHSDDEDEELQTEANKDNGKEDAKDEKDEDEEETEKTDQDAEKKARESNSDDDSDDDSKVGELIADIFGDSDEEGEFEGFGDEELAATKKKKEKKKRKVLSDSEDEEKGETGAGDEQEKKNEDEDGDAGGAERGDGDGDEGNDKQKSQQPDSDSDDGELEGENRSHMVYDFDLMMQKKKDESGKRRRKRGYDIINDSDDLIADLLAQMKSAAEEDRTLNKSRTAATKKLRLLPLVASQLKKSDLKEAFLDQGVLSVMTDWLTPLPDRSLPHLQIREHMLKLLGEFPPMDQTLLKNSGIGRAIMYLYKHPKESRDNREKAGRLISEWARPIFNLNTNFRSMSKEEREKRDFDHMPKKRKERLEAGDESNNDISSALDAEGDKTLKPGVKGWMGRARVPLPSTRDYVVRPKWNVETEFSRPSAKKPLSRLDKHIRSVKEKKKQGKIQRAVTISIEGRKMSL